MATQQVYVSFQPQEYKQNKINILNSQADIIQIIKNIQNIKILKQEETEIKTELHELFFQLNKNLAIFQKKLPNPIIPKAALPPKPKKTKPKTKKISKTKQPISQHERDLDAELQEIQAKLAGLNG